MTARNMFHRRAIGLALLLTPMLALPGSTAAVPRDASDIETVTPRRADTPATPSLWDSPAPSAPVAVSTTQPKRAEPERARSANPLWAIPLATLSNTRERPIFSSSRRPPPPAVAPVVPVAKAAPPPPPPRVERPQLSLVGTIASSEESIGIFIDQASKAALRLRIGEEYQGWRLRAVQTREVTLQRDQQTTILSMPQPSASAPAAGRVQAENTGAQGPADRPLRRGGKR